MQPPADTVSVPTRRGTFRERITSGRFCYGAELVTTRGYAAPNTPSQIVELGTKLCADPRIDWVSVTDNPGGNPMLPPDWLARILVRQQTPVVIHLTCKDLNRNALESTAWQYASEGFENIAAMTGDYPRGGFAGTAAPVFDLDSVSLIAMLEAMNCGVRVESKKGGATLPRTNFYIGCVVSPFKRHERELMPQYFKLLRKIAAGARFVYTQVGYDLRKSHEVKLLLQSNGVGAPVIGNAYLLNKTVAEMFHRHQIAGCVVTDPLMQLVNKYAAGPDRGRSFFIELAAKQLAAFKGLGFAGGYIGGASTAETFFEIIERAERFSPDDWKVFAREIQFCQPDEFYLFERDAETGLGRPDTINPRYLESLSMPAKTRNVTAGFRLARFLHKKVFTPDTPGFRLMKRLYTKLDAKDGALERAAHSVEKLAKFVWFGCQDCGDCSLPDTGYLCPLVACSKGARNGPCGGSADGRCEMLDKECIWARAYERMKFYGESRQMLEGPPVFYQAQLKGTSSWKNTFLGRDHHAPNLQQARLAPQPSVARGSPSVVRGSPTPHQNSTEGLPKESRRADLRSNESAGSADPRTTCEKKGAQEAHAHQRTFDHR